MTKICHKGCKKVLHLECLSYTVHYSLISIYIFAVIKAEHVSHDEGYMFPDDDDDLTEYTGGSVQLMLPSGLLQDFSKYNDSSTRNFRGKFPWHVISKV